MCRDLLRHTAGQGAGDQLLREVAARLDGQLREDDLAVRFGGDEFLVALPRTNAREAERVATRLRDRLEQPITVDDDLELQVGASIGVVSTEEPRPVEELVRAADAAMYARKRERRAARVDAGSTSPRE